MHALPPAGQPGRKQRTLVPQVYLARLYGELPVAVKVMRLPASPMLGEQLQQEASLLHRCRHPGIVQVGASLA